MGWFVTGVCVLLSNVLLEFVFPVLSSSLGITEGCRLIAICTLAGCLLGRQVFSLCTIRRLIPWIKTLFRNTTQCFASVPTRLHSVSYVITSTPGSYQIGTALGRSRVRRIEAQYGWRLPNEKDWQHPAGVPWAICNTSLELCKSLSPSQPLTCPS